MNPEEKQIQFLELYEPCRESLVRFTKAMVKNSDEVMDIVQETTLKAYDGFEKLKNPQAFKSYLFTIASRIYKRSNWRKRLFSSFSSNDENEPEYDNIVDNGTAPDVNHDVEVLRNAMMQLPDKQREAVTLFEISGLSLEEIRDIQGGSLPGVKSRVQRGRKKLAEIMGVDDETNNKPKYTIGTGKKAKTYVQNDRLSVALRSLFAPQEVCYEL
jgi:RNA polymerase sigma-70 factor (ECF subfamily)